MDMKKLIRFIVSILLLTSCESKMTSSLVNAKVYYHYKTVEPYLALTFDDGPRKNQTLQTLSYEEVRSIYRNHLSSLNVSQATKNTAYVDAFYIWRHGSKEQFWEVINAEDFERFKEGVKKMREAVLADEKTEEDFKKWLIEVKNSCKI